MPNAGLQGRQRPERQLCRNTPGPRLEQGVEFTRPRNEIRGDNRDIVPRMRKRVGLFHEAGIARQVTRRNEAYPAHAASDDVAPRRGPAVMSS